ncbi:MAG: ABC transporter permease subunit, partial [Nitrososphaerales archaeon]
SGQVVEVAGSALVPPITDPNNASQREMLVIWSGANGSIPTNYALYYKIGNSTLSTYSLQESNMQLLGTLASRPQIFPLPKLNGSTISDKNNSYMDFVLFYPNGTSTSQTLVFPLNQLYPPPAPPITTTAANSIIIGFFQNLFGLFIPLVAIVGSYTGYGKDRISGVIESVLAQPVSRRGLSLSRYLSIFAAQAIAISIAVALIDAMVFYFTGGFASSTLLISSTLAFFVELAAFTEIMMFFSHVVRSSGALIGIGVGLFMLIDFFWGLIIGLVAGASSTGYNTAQYGQLVIIAQFINPAQFVSLVDTYLTHVATFIGVSSFSLPMTPTTYGVSVLSMTVVAVIWIAVPLAAFLYLSTRRD